MKRVTVYDYGDHYWVFAIDGTATVVDAAETAEEAGKIVQMRLLSPLNPMREFLEDGDNAHDSPKP